MHSRNHLLFLLSPLNFSVMPVSRCKKNDPKIFASSYFVSSSVARLANNSVNLGTNDRGTGMMEKCDGNNKRTNE